MPFGDLFKLPAGRQPPRSAPNRMEGLSFPQKLNYMMQFEGPSLMALGSGMMAGDTAAGFANMGKLQAGYQGAYAETAEEDRIRAQTEQYLIANGIDPAEAKAASQNKDILNHIFDLEEEKIRQENQANNPQNAFAPVWMKRPDGTYYLGSPDPNTGQITEYKTPGQGDTPLDPGSRAEDVAGGKVVGEFNANQAVAAPLVISDGQRTLGLLQELKRDANKGWGTGFTSIANATPGTPGYDFAVRVKQAKATSMTQAVAKLRGLGSMSNADFQAAMDSISRMEVATSRQEFDAALEDYERYLNYSMAIARMQAQRAGVPLNPDYPTTPAAPNAPAVDPNATVQSPKRYNPQTGRVE